MLSLDGLRVVAPVVLKQPLLVSSSQLPFLMWSSQLSMCQVGLWQDRCPRLVIFMVGVLAQSLHLDPELSHGCYVR